MKANATRTDQEKRKEDKSFTTLSKNSTQRARGYLWMVERRSGKTRTRKFFRKGEAKQRDAYIKEIDDKIAKLAQDDHDILGNHRLLEEAVRAAKELQPFGKSIADAVQHYTEYLRAEEQRDKTSVELVVKAFLRTKERKSARHYRDLRSRLGRLERDFGERALSSITEEELERWIESLGYEAQTQRNYRTVLTSLFNYALRKKIIVGTNPMKGVEIEDVGEQEITTLSAEKIASLLFNAPPKLLPSLVLMAFCGLRNSEVVKKTNGTEEDLFLDWASINWNSKTVTITGSQAKGTRKRASRRVVDLPDNALEWLRPFKKLKGRIADFPTADLFNDALVKLRKKSGFGPGEWPHNALRKTFISCHYATYRNETETAAQAGNSPVAIRTYYLDLIDREEAARLWEIRPENEENGKVVNL